MTTSFNSNNKTNIVDALKDNISIQAVTEKLNLVPQYHLTPHGDELTGDCITGHPSQNHQCFTISLDKNFFYCFHCQANGDIINLVSLALNLEFKQSLHWLAEQFRPDLLPLIEQQEYRIDPDSAKFYQQSLLYESVFALGKKLLYEPTGETSLNALQARGYSVDLLRMSEWIYWPTENGIRKHLSALYPTYADAIKDLRLTGYFGDNFRLAFPYRDRRGQITGFMKRADNKRGFDVKGQTGVRWDSTPGLKKDDLYGLDKIKKTDTLVIVEGYPDALYIPTLGFTNIAAVGQGRLSKTHVVGLKSRKIKRVIISFDNDPPKAGGVITGVENTEAAIDLLNEAGIDAFVIDPPLLGQYKDPDELVVAEGITAFEQLVQNAELGAKWKARRILTKHDLTTDLGKDAALHEALAYEDAITNPMASKAVIDIICSGLNMPLQMLEPYLKDYHEKKAQERLRDATEELLKDVSTELQAKSNGLCHAHQ